MVHVMSSCDGNEKIIAREHYGEIDSSSTNVEPTYKWGNIYQISKH